MVISEKARRLMRSLGTAEEVRKLMDQSRKDREAFFALKPKLVKEHPDQWAAFFQGEVVGFAASLDELLTLIDARGLPRAWVFTHFLNKKKVTLVL
ncbi:MAG: hypothetical protein HYX92_17180 [Chloroflexi bacterium]|nr:hypothetical protein [Chloroflexota bacterium]